MGTTLSGLAQYLDDVALECYACSQTQIFQNGVRQSPSVWTAGVLQQQLGSSFVADGIGKQAFAHAVGRLRKGVGT